MCSDRFPQVYVHTAFDALFPATNEMDAWRQGFLANLRDVTGKLLDASNLSKGNMETFTHIQKLVQECNFV